MKFAKLALLAGVALSVRPLLAGENIAKLVPAEMNAAGFVNLEAIKRDYGMLFDGGPIAEQLDQLVAAGLPDPRETIDQLAIAGQLEAMEADRFLVLATGSLRVKPIVDLAVQMQGGTVEEEAYRGATILSIREADGALKERFADLTEGASMASFDKSGEHPFVKTTIDLAGGQGASYAERYGTELGADEYAVFSVELPKSLRQDLEKQDMLSFLSLVVHVRAKLVKVGAEVRLGIDGVCMDEFDAETVKRALVKVRDALGEQADGANGELIKSISIERREKTVALSLQLPEQLVKEILAGLTGTAA